MKELSAIKSPSSINQTQIHPDKMFYQPHRKFEVIESEVLSSYDDNWIFVLLPLSKIAH